MHGLVAVGACYLDTILTVDYYPTEDEKLRASRLEKRRGGNVANTLEVIQQLLQRQRRSVPLTLLAVMPGSSSPATRQIQSSLGPGVDFSHCLYRESSSEAPSSYIIRSLATGSRTIVNYYELAEMAADEFIKSADNLSGTALAYHFEGRIPDVTAECIRYLRQNHPKVKVSVEIEKPNRAGLQELAAEADIVFHSKSWAKAQGYQSAEECLRAQAGVAKKASHLFCTWGGEGAAALKTSQKTIFHAQAFHVEGAGKRVIDTIGAGDTFIAGILYALLYNSYSWDLERALGFANELAGRKVAQEGFSGLMQGLESWFEPYGPAKPDEAL